MHDDRVTRFREQWDAVRIVRNVPYTLFTFGDTDLPYALVLEPDDDSADAGLVRGQITISRPKIITPGPDRPEFDGFFDEDDAAATLMMARGVKIPRLRFANTSRDEESVGSDVETLLARVVDRLEDEDEDRVAVLSAPRPLAGTALVRYAVEKAIESTPGNIGDLRDRGLLP
ncbi:MAG: hypothetical protein AAGJ97_04750 [Planctomycetota bacterium]